MPTIRCVVTEPGATGFRRRQADHEGGRRRAGRCLGSYCWVVSDGPVSVGDEAALKENKHRALADAARRTKRFAFGMATAAMDRFSR